MDIVSEYNNMKVEVQCTGLIGINNLSNENMDIKINKFKVNNKCFDINKLTDAYIDFSDKENILLSVFNKNKEKYINIDISNCKDIVLEENKKVLDEINKRFEDTYNLVINDNALLKIEYNKVLGFIIKNINPFNLKFIEIEKQMDSKKDKILSEYKDLEEGKEIILEIKSLLEILS